MACKKCKWYQHKLSPLEDKVFTARFLAKEPKSWMSKQIVERGGMPYIMFNLPDVWQAAFKEPSPHRSALTNLGRTLDALGWERTKVGGLLFFRMPLKEFADYCLESK